MKRTAIAILLFALSLSILGCDFNAAYYDDAEIAKIRDSHLTKMSFIKSVGREYNQTATFTGTKTIWRYNASSDDDVSLSYLLSVSEGGKAKLVLITPDNEVIILIENTDNTVYTEMQTQTISVKRGVSRIKIVGHESPKIEVSLRTESGRFITD